MQNPTPERLEQLFSYIQTYLNENGYAPSFRDISGSLNWSLRTVQRYVEQLENDGRISRKGRVARSLTLNP